MRRQAELAIETADVILFLVDGRDGMTSADEEVAAMLRHSNKPVVLGVNKVDAPKFEEAMYEFYALGLGEPITISASQGLGLGDLLDEIVKDFPKASEAEQEKRINIALAGKPNVGKSSIVNALLGEERSIVSDVPGTTRDSIDTNFSHDGKLYTLVDTAGIRRKRSIEDESIERYSVIRSLAAVRRADVVLIVCDSSEGMTEQDVKIAGYVHEQGKPSIVVMNKWDLVDKDTYTKDKFDRKLREELKFMDYFRSLYVSALTGKRVDNILGECRRVLVNSRRRIATGLLNEVLQEAIRTSEPPSRKGNRLKIYYITETSVAPPTFVLKVNDPELMHFSYQRYIENALRRAFDFEGTPIRIIVRHNKEED